MIYYTGDLHGDMERILDWLETIRPNVKNNPIYLIVLGDAGLNYYHDGRDKAKKKMLQDKIRGFMEPGTEIKVLFVRGNHESRPNVVLTYEEIDMFGGTVYQEMEFPDLLFLKDGEIYQIENKNFLVLGGGYSEDFFDRILRGEGYWFDEQLSRGEFEEILHMLSLRVVPELYVLSHMLPTQALMKTEKEFSNKTRTEYWLNTVYLLYKDVIKKWIAGHYHTSWESEDHLFEIIYRQVRKLE